jgi:hypothetical protein
MNNSTVSIKISAAFLATVLVVGIIAISSPSFMVGAQAAPGYGMDSYDKKSNGKDVSIKKVKCNNINVNVNGVVLNTTSVPFLSDLLGSGAYADEGDSGASSYGSGGSYGSDGSYGDKKSGSDKSFKFICINNNNNTVGVPPVPVDECESCFDEVTLTFPITVILPPLGTITIEDFEELCNLIFSPPFSTSAEQLLRLVEEIVPEGTPQAVIDDIVCNCLVPLLGIQGACPPGPPT